MPGERGPRVRQAMLWGGLVLLVVASWALRYARRGTGAPLDTLTYFLPIYAATAERLADGILPTWNPYQLCGLPWLATWQGGFFYPPHLLYVLLPLNAAFAASNLVHLVLVALATALFVRRIGLGPAAALLAAVLFGLRGRIPHSLFSPNHLEAVAWLPVGALALVDLVRRPGARPTALLAASMGASLLAGYPQPTVFVVYTWATLLVALLIAEGADRRSGVRALVAFAAALGLGAMLAAVQLLPALELASVGTRATSGLNEQEMFAGSAAFTPAVIPLRFGAIAGAPSAWGVAALALAPVALVARRHLAIAWWAFALAVVTALFSLGELTPAFSVYRALPALEWFRNPARILTISEFGLAIAAAFGLDALRGSPAPDGTAVRSRIAPAVALAALGGVVYLAATGWAPSATLGRVVAGAAVAATALGVAAISARLRTGAVAALVALALVEVSSGPPLAWRLPYAAADTARYRTVDAPYPALAERIGHDRMWHYGYGLQAEPVLKRATLHRLRAIDDYEPQNLARQSDVFSYLSEGTIARRRQPWLFAGQVTTLEPPSGTAPADARRRLLDLMAVRFVVAPAGIRIGQPAFSAFLERAGWVLADDGPTTKVFENPSALPRAYVTYRTLPAPANAERLLAMISRPTYDPLVATFVEGDVPGTAAADAPRGRPARFVRDDESEVELEATLDRPGLVVLADSFYPGWRATVDGAPAPILAANHLFRGVAVGAGTHRVRFVYAPASLRIGAACTAAALLVLLILLGRGQLRDRRDAQAEREPRHQP